jgi:hypothetical protein
MGATCVVVVEIELSAGTWTDVSPDVEATDHVRIRYGINGNSPLDRVASTGTLAFTLRNDAANSGHLQGYYSPNHRNCRAGFQFGAKVRVRLTHSGVTVTKFHGKLTTISPVPGKTRAQRTQCIATDWMEEAAVTDIRDIAPQESKTADELVAAVLAVMPASSQPVATDLDVCTDVFPYCFDKLGGGTVYAMSVLSEIVQSEVGYLFVHGGTLVLQNRSARDLVGSALTLDNSMRGLHVPSTLDNVFNRVRATIHPRTVDASPVVLCALTGEPPAVGPGETLTLWLDYRDPADPTSYIGGTGFLTPRVTATTDYTANSAADGSGTNLTGSLTVVATAFAASAKLEVTNGAGSTAYITRLQLRGRGVYDLQPATYEVVRTQPYGERRLDVDMPYQDDPAVAEGVAAYIADRYQWPAHDIEAVEIIGNASDTLMAAVLVREPGDRITLSEEMTGLVAAEAYIQRVDLDIAPGPWLVCQWGLAPALADHYWILGDATYGLLGTTTRLGYV